LKIEFEIELFGRSLYCKFGGEDNEVHGEMKELRSESDIPFGFAFADHAPRPIPSLDPVYTEEFA
jgi:hypothetical protein